LWTVETAHSAGDIYNLALADAAFDPASAAIVNTATAAVINFRDTKTQGGKFQAANGYPDVPFPNMLNEATTDGNINNNFAVKVTGSFSIKDEGYYTFFTFADDGLRLRVDGEDTIVDNFRHPEVPRFGTRYLSSGSHSLELVFFEYGVGAALELAIAPGSLTTFPDNGFELLQASGSLDEPPAESGSFQYYRFTPTKLRGDSMVQLSELSFYNRLLPSGSPPKWGAIVTNPGGSNPPNERPDKANDDDDRTKWLDFNVKPLVYDFGESIKIYKYNFRTANDFPRRDPVRWTLEGSNDGTTWVMLDDRTSVDYLTTTLRWTQTPWFSLPISTSGGD
jgi:hypothetical protein